MRTPSGYTWPRWSDHVAFGNIGTFYLPIPASAGASLWGTDVRKVLDVADGSSDSTTKTNHGTGAAVNRVVDPFTTTTTDDNTGLYGFAITATDMNSVVGALRMFPAGNHVATMRVVNSDTNAAAGFQASMYVFRVGPAPGRTRTLIASATGQTFPLPGSLAGTTTNTLTVTCPEIVFEAGETVQWQFRMSGAGAAITGRLVTIYTGTEGGVAVRISTPTLKILAQADGASAGSGAGSGDSQKILNAAFSGTGVGTVTGVMGATGSMDGSSSGVGTGTGVGAATSSMEGSSAGSAAVAGLLGAFGGMEGSTSGVATTSGVLGAFGGMVASADGVGTAVGELSATSGTVGAASGVGEALGLGSSVAGTEFSSVGEASSSGLASIVLGTVGTSTVGGESETIVYNPLIFLDED